MTSTDSPPTYDITVQLAGSVHESRATLKSRIVQAAAAALKHAGAPADMSAAIVLSDDNHLRALNREFAGIDAATDVLSFPAGDAAPASPPGEAPHAGDVIISLERAAAQAAAGGHSLEAEVELLTVHGVLHLCGHDHAAPADSTRMWRAQAAILNSIDSDITGPAV